MKDTDSRIIEAIAALRTLQDDGCNWPEVKQLIARLEKMLSHCN